MKLVQQIAHRLGLLSPDDVEARRETQIVLEAARAELDESRRARVRQIRRVQQLAGAERGER